MNKAKTVTLGILVGTLFLTSCKKDEDTTGDSGTNNSNTGSTAQVTSIVVSSSGGTQTHIPEYDATGRLIKTYNLLGAEVSFEYNGNTMTQSDTWNTETTTYTLNSDGEPTSAVTSEGDNITYTYNSDGNLTQEKETRQNGDVITDNYTWAAGSITGMVSNQNYGSSTTTVTYDYTLGGGKAKGPAVPFLQYYLFISGYPSFGTHSTNVITGNTSASYTYSLDADGNITSVTDGDITVTFNF